MKKYPFSHDMLTLGRKFNQAGFSLYLVGGAVRDYLLGKENDDADFTTDATPDEVINLFPKSTIPTGIKHGTVTVVFNKQPQVYRRWDWTFDDKPFYEGMNED